MSGLVVADVDRGDSVDINGSQSNVGGRLERAWVFDTSYYYGEGLIGR